MAKWLFWILLLANALFLAFMQWGQMLTGSNKFSLHQPEMNADKVVVLAAPPELHSPVSLPVTPIELQIPPAADAACLEWGEFSGRDLERSSAALAALNLGSQLSQRQIEYASGYWAYISPSKSRAEADRKIAVLKSRGVEDYFIVQETGKWHNAISLGVFKTREAALKYVGRLREKDIKTAIVGERMSKLKFTVFVLKKPDAGVLAQLAALQGQFDGSELRSVACD